jgi:amidohydrolase
MDKIKTRIEQLAKKHTQAMIKLRRQLHQYPETALEEYKTQKIIASKLKQVGCKTNTRIWKTAVVGLLQGKHKGRTIGVRSDMDALPITEKTGYKFASRNPGRMHACGHDAHMAIVWGTARILSELRHQMHGNVKFIYQPAEEAPPGGAKYLIEKGVLKNPKVDMVFGLHVDCRLPAGRFGLLDGPMMAHVADFDIEIVGKSGHAAAPHKTVDAVIVAANVVTALQNIASRQVDPMEPVVITIGAIKGGTASNIIADRVEMTGTVRTLDAKMSRAMPKMIDKIIAGVCKTFGAGYDLDYRIGYPMLVNDKYTNDIYRRAATELYGRQAAIETEKMMGGEDFAYYAQQVPSALIWSGIRNPKIGADEPWHSSRFKIDEKAIPLSAALLALAAWRAMEK